MIQDVKSNIFQAESSGGGRVGLRRRFKAPISSEARVRIPSFAFYLLSLLSFFFCGRMACASSWEVINVHTSITSITVSSHILLFAGSFQHCPCWECRKTSKKGLICKISESSGTSITLHASVPCPLNGIIAQHYHFTLYFVLLLE